MLFPNNAQQGDTYTSETGAKYQFTSTIRLWKKVKPPSVEELSGFMPVGVDQEFIDKVTATVSIPGDWNRSESLYITLEGEWSRGLANHTVVQTKNEFYSDFNQGRYVQQGLPGEWNAGLVATNYVADNYYNEYTNSAIISSTLSLV